MCQKTQTKGDGVLCYWIDPEAVTWPEAQAQCERSDASLALVSGFLENALVVELLREQQVTQAWIGLTESFTSWKWLSGECSRVVQAASHITIPA